MNHWPFIISAYAFTAVGTIGVILWAYMSMKRAERGPE
jgi:hypothetical protein